MSSGSTLILAVMAVVITCVAVSAAARRQAGTWNHYHFDGQGFAAGQPADDSPFLAVRDRVVPVVLTRAARAEATALPPGTGALAGICFLRSSGGKLAAGRAYAPSPGMPLTISSGTATALHTQTDGSGFFVALLPAGVYRVSSGAFSIEARVEVGKTTLTALPTGKRMVD